MKTIVNTEKTPAEYLRDLAERIMKIPIKYGTDQGDCEELYALAQQIEDEK